MSVFSPTQNDYTNLAHALAKFSSLTQIKTFYYGFNGILLKNDTMYLNDSDIKPSLIKEDLSSFALFPISLDNQLWGLMLCDTSNVTQKRLSLARAYLINLLQQSFVPATSSIKVWDALKNDQIKQMNYFYNILFPTDGYLTTQNTFPSFSDTPNHPNSSDAYQSIKLAMSYIHSHIHQSLSLHEVANAAYLSPAYLSRLFKRYLDVSFVEYVNNQKIALAQEKLALTFIPINKISAQLGFSQTSYFTKIFKRKTNLTPSEFRQHNHAIQKVYTIPRELDWHTTDSVNDVTQKFFDRQNIIYHTENNDGKIYVTQIGDLTDFAGTRGWAFTVDGQQFSQSVDKVHVQNKSVIQWIYMNYANQS